MLNINPLIHTPHTKTKVISRVINLGNDLNLFITGSCYDTSFLDYLVNKILDYSIESISSHNTYKDVSSILDHINAVLDTWTYDSEGGKMNLIIGVLNNNELLFSAIGNASAYLVQEQNIIEITDKKDKKKKFTFISNGKLSNGDLMVFSNKRLLNLLSESDFIDSYHTDTKVFNNAIKSIFTEDKIEKNIAITSLSFNNDITPNKKPVIAFIQNIFLNISDTTFVKRIFAILLIFKDKITTKGTMLKNILFIIIIVCAITLLYFVIQKTISSTSQTDNITIYKEQLVEAQISLRKASESISNTDIFDLNINNTINIIGKLEKKNLFLEDIKLLKSEVSKIKKIFNGIEFFNEETAQKILMLQSENSVKVLSVRNKIYLISNTSITGPIIKGSTPQKHIFKEIGNDSFIDATDIDTNISLLTKKGKVVLFENGKNFRFSDVIGQDFWEKSHSISSYNTNIYLVGTDENQIFKHKKSGNSFTKSTAYLKSEDQTSIGKILSIAIDGGFYLLKEDLSIVKFFANPQYRLESLSLNKLPKNYKIDDTNNLPIIKAGPQLNYVYMLLNNKIFIFKPNSKRYQDTKSLTYIGQIEGQNSKIIDFYVKHDGEIIILNAQGIYKMLFEISNNKVLLR